MRWMGCNDCQGNESDKAPIAIIVRPSWCRTENIHVHLNCPREKDMATIQTMDGCAIPTQNVEFPRVMAQTNHRPADLPLDIPGGLSGPI